MTHAQELQSYFQLATCYTGNMPTIKPSTIDKLETLTEHLIADVDSNSISQHEAKNILALAQYCCIN